MQILHCFGVATHGRLEMTLGTGRALLCGASCAPEKPRQEESSGRLNLLPEEKEVEQTGLFVKSVNKWYFRKLGRSFFFFSLHLLEEATQTLKRNFFFNKRYTKNISLTFTLNSSNKECIPEKNGGNKRGRFI